MGVEKLHRPLYPGAIRSNETFPFPVDGAETLFSVASEDFSSHCRPKEADNAKAERTHNNGSISERFRRPNQFTVPASIITSAAFQRLWITMSIWLGFTATKSTSTKYDQRSFEMGKRTLHGLLRDQDDNTVFPFWDFQMRPLSSVSLDENGS